MGVQSSPEPSQQNTLSGLSALTATSVDVVATPCDVPRLLHDAAQRLCTSASAFATLTTDGDHALTVNLSPGVTARMFASREARQDLAEPSGFRFHLHLRSDHEIPRESADRWARVWHAQPLSALECARVAGELPLMSTVTAGRQEDQVLAGSAVIVTGHFLSDLTHLVDCLAALGAPYAAMTVLQKDYSYRLRHRVAGHLTERGVRIHSADHADAAVHEHTTRARAAGLRPLALDDGGYVAPILLDDPGLADGWTGIVEQTMSGVYKLEGREKQLTFPVFSVAQSRLKGRIESYWIADKAVTTALDLLPPLKIEGQPALVIGFGNVGEQIADCLRQRRMRVAVHDTDLLRLIEAHEHGYVTRRELGGVLTDHAPLLIFGATGRGSMGRAEFEALRRNCFLASVTSRDIEFDLPALADLTVAPQATDATGTCHRLQSGTLVTVLAGGRPVNFHETDSISNLHSDLVYAGMLIGAHTLGSGPHPPGLDPAWADDVLEHSGLLEQYYDRYGPNAPAHHPSQTAPGQGAQAR